MTIMSDPKSILLDIQKEVAGELLSETYVVRGRKWTMRLLNEDENAWTFSLANVKNQVSLALSVRLANLAIGIKEIDGTSVADIFDAKYLELSDAERELTFNSVEPKFIYTHLMYEFLKELPPSYINELQAKWQELEKSREDAQAELKNSSGESLDKEENKNLTELSQSGDK